MQVRYDLQIQRNLNSFCVHSLRPSHSRSSSSARSSAVCNTCSIMNIVDLVRNYQLPRFYINSLLMQDNRSIPQCHNRFSEINIKTTFIVMLRLILQMYQLRRIRRTVAFPTDPKSQSIPTLIFSGRKIDIILIPNYQLIVESEVLA